MSGHFLLSALREILVLKNLQHENVTKLRDVIIAKDTKSVDVRKDEDREEDDRKHNRPKHGPKSQVQIYAFLIFDYMEYELFELWDRHEVRFTAPEIKSFMKQLLMGLQYCHDKDVLHRDIKGQNLLVNKQGILKISDFGLSRLPVPDRSLTNNVVTLWYRPPELLLGSEDYTTAVDMWSVGCIFAWLLNDMPILSESSTEVGQLTSIVELCGSFQEESWPGVSKLPNYALFKSLPPQTRKIREKFQL